MSEWIEIRKPKDGEEYLVSVCDDSGDNVGYYTTVATAMIRGDNILWLKDDEELYGVYAYMDMPAYYGKAVMRF